MTIPVINKFGEDNALTTEAMNEVILTLVGAVNSIAGSPVVRVQTTGGVANNSFVPVTGGQFSGAISAPSMLVGPKNDKQQVVTKGNTATTTEAGIIQQLEAVADLSTTISDPPTQAEVKEIKDKLNDVLAKARAAGALDA